MTLRRRSRQAPPRTAAPPTGACALATALALAAAIALAACGDGYGGSDDRSSRSGAPASERVEIESFDFKPDPVEVRAGGAVTWTNRDGAPHTATADEGAPAEFGTDRLDRGDSRRVTLDEPGTYAYHCDFHRTMTAMVEVVE